MSAFEDAWNRERISRAREILVSYENVGWDKLPEELRGTLETLRWVTGESDTEPETLLPEDWE